jgi:plasmid stability protein
MSVQGASVHPKLCDEAIAELKLLAALRGKSVQAIAEDLLHRALLGESYAFKVAAELAERSGRLGKGR